MNASEQIITKQIEWARNRGLRLIGSQGDRGRKVYTTNLRDNLFQPLNTDTRLELEKGDGGELWGSTEKPAKIQALHSSAALGVNVFDYWRSAGDLSILTTSCGLSKGSSELRGNVRFEQKVPIDDRFQFAPNIDVVVALEGSPFACYAIECKFTEPYSSYGHSGLDGKYLESEHTWQGLPETRRLAEEISPEDCRFRFLHAAQLIKHLLGLNRRHGHAQFRLLYLWYDAYGEPGHRHRQEVSKFADIVFSDGVKFHSTTYQDLIYRLARHREQGNEYIKYLTGRYL